MINWMKELIEKVRHRVRRVRIQGLKRVLVCGPPVFAGASSGLLCRDGVFPRNDINQLINKVFIDYTPITFVFEFLYASYFNHHSYGYFRWCGN